MAEQQGQKAKFYTDFSGSLDRASASISKVSDRTNTRRSMLAAISAADDSLINKAIASVRETNELLKLYSPGNTTSYSDRFEKDARDFIAAALENKKKIDPNFKTEAEKAEAERIRIEQIKLAEADSAKRAAEEEVPRKKALEAKQLQEAREKAIAAAKDDFYGDGKSFGESILDAGMGLVSGTRKIGKGLLEGGATAIEWLASGTAELPGIIEDTSDKLGSMAFGYKESKDKEFAMQAQDVIAAMKKAYPNVDAIKYLDDDVIYAYNMKRIGPRFDTYIDEIEKQYFSGHESLFTRDKYNDPVLSSRLAYNYVNNIFNKNDAIIRNDKGYYNSDQQRAAAIDMFNNLMKSVPVQARFLKHNQYVPKYDWSEKYDVNLFDSWTADKIDWPIFYTAKGAGGAFNNYIYKKPGE